MIVYRAGERVPESELFDLGPPEGLGGTVLDGEKGPGSTSRWSFPSGVFVWDNPSLRLEGATYTITLTVYSRTGASSSATATVSYP